ncbi:MAG: hypothetical protein ACRDE2_13340, partial [Chitinophagaceae bacterium]
ANTAFQSWQTTLNALSQKANLALGYDQLGVSLKQLKQENDQFNASPAQRGIKSAAQMKIDTKKYSSFGDVMGAYMSDPTFIAALGGPAAASESIYNSFKQNHPGYNFTPQEIAQLGIYGGKTIQAGAGVGAQVNMGLVPILHAVGAQNFSTPGNPVHTKTNPVLPKFDLSGLFKNL